MSEKKAKPKKNNALVVGIGASAGGLEPLKKFIRSLPDETGMAFILIQHLSPTHKSRLAEILQEETSLKVQQVTRKTLIKTENIYIIPPKKQLVVGDTHLELTDFKDGHKPNSVDLFFRSLGQEKGAGSAVIILSGSGSDGAVGMKAVKENNGLTIAQDPEEAQYSSMPENAINTGLIDHILPVKEMYAELAAYRRDMIDGKVIINGDDLSEDDQNSLTEIIKKLNTETENDFSSYKKTTLLRRVERRRHITQNKSLWQYYTYLNQNPKEVHELFKDLLITVTNFFRNPEAFEALEKEVIPKLFEKNEAREQLRIWVPGCATGEEAYSIAILLLEYAQKNKDGRDIQIFATDLDEHALNTGRKGIYPESISADISEKRLNRYFHKENGRYRVRDELRKIVLFVKHNLLRSPPFSKLNLISCRNLLIYLNRDMQSEVFNLFHYALRSEGYLFLGKSDSNLEATELFTKFNKHNIYRQSSKVRSALPLPEFPIQIDENRVTTSHSWRIPARIKQDFKKLHSNLLLREYAPPGAIINENYEVLYAGENIDPYLKYRGGEPSRNILDMVITELRGTLRGLLFKAGKNGKEFSIQKKVHVQLNGDSEFIEIDLQKIKEKGYPDDLMHVVFKKLDIEKDRDGKKAARQKALDEGDSQVLRELEDELHNTKEQLQTTIEDYEIANEELRSTNEELQSMNEEMQTTTEELETSQEELQSVNEELKTVNSELESKMDKLNWLNSDLKNLMGASPTGLLIINKSLEVHRFTHSVTEVFNLIEADIGRPLEHLSHHLQYASVLDDVKKVLNTLQKEKQVLTTDNGSTYIMEISPYLTQDDKVEGAVISFVDITRIKEDEQKLQLEARQVEALAQLGLHAVEGRPLEEVMRHGLQIACEVLAVDYCLLLKLDRSHNEFQIINATGMNDEEAHELEIHIDKKWNPASSMGKMKSQIIEDFRKEKCFCPVPVFEDKEMVSGINAVIQGSKEPYGILAVYTEKKHSFTGHDKAFLQVVANIFAEMIDRDKAERKLSDANEELQDEFEHSKKLQQEILDSSMAERWELGGFLHDTLGQKLVALKMMADGITQKRLGEGADSIVTDLKTMQDILGESINEIRTLAQNIIPVDIDTGIANAFEHLMKHSQKLYGIECKLEYDEGFTKIKDRKLATNLYLIVQEAIKNAVLHGKTKHIKVTALCNDKLVLQVHDDGSGMTKEGRKKSDGSGTRIMQHRVDLLKGSLQIKNEGNGEYKGVTVTCKVPLK